MCEEEAEVLVIGLGNPLRRDDGIGPRLIAELIGRGLPDGVGAVDVGGGALDLLCLLEGPREVIIVDAAEIGREAGQFVRLGPEDVRLVSGAGRLSLHSADLAEVLGLAQSLGRSLAKVVIYGVQPESLEWQEGLTPAVERALPGLVEAVMREACGESEETPIGGSATSDRGQCHRARYSKGREEKDASQSPDR